MNKPATPEGVASSEGLGVTEVSNKRELLFIIALASSGWIAASVGWMTNGEAFIGTLLTLVI